MNEFIGDFWGAYIAVITLASCIACGALAPWNPRSAAARGQGKRQ